MSACLVGAKFQEDLLPDLDANGQLCPLQEANVTYYMNHMIVYHSVQVIKLKDNNPKCLTKREREMIEVGCANM